MVCKIFNRKEREIKNISHSSLIYINLLSFIFLFPDSVARMSYSQTMHPKESLICQGLSNKSIFLKNHDECM